MGMTNAPRDGRSSINQLDTGRAPGTDDAFARLIRFLRWPVLLVWVVAVVLLAPVAAGLSGVADDSAAAYLPSAAASTKVALLQQHAEAGPGQPESVDAIVVAAASRSLTSADLSAIATMRMRVAGLAAGTPGLSEPARIQPSSDGKAAFFAVRVTAPQHDLATAATDAVKRMRAQLSAEPRPSGLDAVVTGAAAVEADSGSGGQGALLLTSILIVAVILVVVYRSPFLWLLPLIAAVGAIVVAQASAHGLANAGLTVSSLSTAILVVLTIGAASDYALLLVHRYREELGRHARTDDAMAATLRSTVRTLAASAATVVGAMLCLLAAGSASLHGLGPIAAAGIASALLAETTLLPALLLVVGRRAFWPRAPRPGDQRATASRVWTPIGAWVGRQPAAVAIGSVLLLVVAATGLATFRTANDPLSNVRERPDSVVGAQLLEAHYPPGTIAPLVLLAPPAQAGAAAATAQSSPGIASVASAPNVGAYRNFSVALAVNPYSSAAQSAIETLRTRLANSAPDALVGGDPAVEMDIANAAGNDARVLIPLIFVVILVVVGMLLRAIVAPLLLVGATALSFAASFGLSNLLWTHVLGFPGIAALLPLYIFIFLVAVGIDYAIFLSARVREEGGSFGTRVGTARALSLTGGVITAAGFVLAGTFAALAELPSVQLTEVGSAIALGVLVDTLFARTVLVPALFMAVGDRVWWPSRIAGDAPHAQPPHRTNEMSNELMTADHTGGYRR